MAPSFSVPPGDVIVHVQIIDTTARIGGVPCGALIEPPFPGFTHLPKVPSWAFLIEHKPSGRKVLFDLGVPTDWRSMSPTVTIHPSWDVSVTKDTGDILEENGISLDQINSIIWSHWHWDHLGDPKKFPPTTEIVVGPGFKTSFLPGYPTKADSPVRESDFAGRQVREIDFGSTTVQTGRFPAFDFFGDGSFYLLDTPGHAVGHLCGLARTTTTPDTFILMGGDLCHHSGELRPSPLMPLPQDQELHSLLTGLALSCVPTNPSALLQSIQESRGRLITESFFDPAMGHDIPETLRTIHKAQEADADEHIWFVYAHDLSLLNLKVDLFPAEANGWKEKGWSTGTRWAFLDDFRVALQSAGIMEES